MIRSCDTLFQTYATCSRGRDEDKTVAAYTAYQSKRVALNKTLLEQHETEYLKILTANDDHQLWQKINWSGKMGGKSNNRPDVAELADHFSQLYEPLDSAESEEMGALHSLVYIPANDDAINERELKAAASSMKKGGWDFSLPVLKMLLQCVPATMLLLMNLLFFCFYPLKLALSILHAIPKTGNLMFCSNYRGIQMQPLIALLYDRILANRFIQWAKISHE